MTRRPLLALLAAHALLASPVLADPAAPSPMQEAGQHFERGVSLYDEADYRAALIEFRRAYEIAPNAVVLYNVGETYYQLQNYAAALTALERYLAESGDAADHRAEVQKTIGILKTRVGKIAITTNVPGCEITIDDEFVGTSPLAHPVSISIGRRKITAMRTGLPPDTRFIEIAAGDTAAASLVLVKPAPIAPLVLDARAAGNDGRGTLVTASWITTGVLGVGALTFGALAFKESRDLSAEKGKLGASASDLSSKASHVKTFSAIGDIAGIAALVSGVVSLKLTLSRSSTHEVHAALAPTGILVGGNF